MILLPLEAPPHGQPLTIAARPGDREFRARRGTHPLFASPQEAEAFDFGYECFEWGQDPPSEDVARTGWLAADKCYGDDREARVAERRERA